MGEALLIKFGGEVANPYEGIEVAPGYATVLLTVMDSDGDLMQGMQCTCGGITNITNALGQATFMVNNTGFVSVMAGNWCINTNQRYIDQQNRSQSINIRSYNGQNYLNKVLPITLQLNRLYSFAMSSNYNNTSAYLSLRVSNRIRNLRLMGAGGTGIPATISRGDISNSEYEYAEAYSYIRNFFSIGADITQDILNLNKNMTHANIYNYNYCVGIPKSSSFNIIGGHGGGGAESIFINSIEINSSRRQIWYITLGSKNNTGYSVPDSNVWYNKNTKLIYSSIDRIGTGGTSSFSGFGIQISAIGGRSANNTSPGLGGYNENKSYSYNFVTGLTINPGMDGGYRGRNSTSSHQNCYCGGGGGGWDSSTNTYGVSINNGGSGDFVDSSNIFNGAKFKWYKITGGDYSIGGNGIRSAGRGGGGGGIGIGAFYYNNRSNIIRWEAFLDHEASSGYLSFEME